MIEKILTDMLGAQLMMIAKLRAELQEAKAQNDLLKQTLLDNSGKCENPECARR